MYVCIYLCRSFQYLASLDNFCELNIRQSSMLVAIVKAMIYNFCHHICFHSFSFANIVRQLTFPYIWQSPRIPRHVNAHESHISPIFLHIWKKRLISSHSPPPYDSITKPAILQRTKRCRTFKPSCCWVYVGAKTTSAHHPYLVKRTHVFFFQRNSNNIESRYPYKMLARLKAPSEVNICQLHLQTLSRGCGTRLLDGHCMSHVNPTERFWKFGNLCCMDMIDLTR